MYGSEPEGPGVRGRIQKVNWLGQQAIFCPNNGGEIRAQMQMHLNLYPIGCRCDNFKYKETSADYLIHKHEHRSYNNKNILQK